MKKEKNKNRWTRRFLIVALAAFIVGAGCMAVGGAVGISKGEVEAFAQKYAPGIEFRMDSIFQD